MHLEWFERGWKTRLTFGDLKRTTNLSVTNKMKSDLWLSEKRIRQRTRYANNRACGSSSLLVGDITQRETTHEIIQLNLVDFWYMNGAILFRTVVLGFVRGDSHYHSWYKARLG